ncbi:tyrosine-type recombinase/integrase [Geodermatophilus sabuli]|uniref:Phage integrase family protein n=1 Tax=Geodermatophilus sabuli TaxID=1564158 RepID=A0A285EBK4_9ACTN|nr:tyrosine-type recombinase/integrase [Geodermatophilus sabuli]MBB3084220.1 integrase [Geodermatophilus sabuli]SNX96508.1 Phage integrase family protein [Geodermatophilus sabuli]
MPSSARTGRVDPRLVAVLADDEPSGRAAEWPAPAGTNDLGDRDAVARLFARGPRPPGAALVAVDETTSAQLLHELAVAEELAGNALAATTRASYTSHVHGFTDWCRARGIDPLQASAHQVGLHLSGYAVAFGENGQPRRTADGKLVPAVAAVSVSTRLAAIDKAFELLGRPKPGDDPELRRVLRGIRRTFSVRPRYAKAALDLPRLRRVLTVVHAGRFEQRREHALLLLRARTRATGGQLARLRWTDIVLEPMRVTITLQPERRGGPVRAVTVTAHRDETLCLVTALRNLRAAAPHLKEIAVHADGEPIARTTVYQLVERRLPAGLDLTAPPGRLDAALRPALRPDKAGGSTASLRDAAALLTCFFAALRRSELTTLTWGQLAWIGGQVRVFLVTSKTDQEGEGDELWLPPVADPLMCPVTALNAWRAHVTELTGADPVTRFPDEPVFVSVDRYGRARRDRAGRLRPLNDHGFNEMVQRRCLAAGLVKPPTDPETRRQWRNPFGGHSCRVGFVTEGLRQGLGIAEIAEQTRHRDMNTLKRYQREYDRQHNNIAKKLVEAAGLALAT